MSAVPVRIIISEAPVEGKRGLISVAPVEGKRGVVSEEPLEGKRGVMSEVAVDGKLATTASGQAWDTGVPCPSENAPLRTLP